MLGGTESRHCSIPNGTAILLPLLHAECDYGIPSVKNDADLRGCARAGNNYGVITASIDGKPVDNVDQ